MPPLTSIATFRTTQKHNPPWPDLTQVISSLLTFPDVHQRGPLSPVSYSGPALIGSSLGFSIFFKNCLAPSWSLAKI